MKTSRVKKGIYIFQEKLIAEEDKKRAEYEREIRELNEIKQVQLELNDEESIDSLLKENEKIDREICDLTNWLNEHGVVKEIF